LGQKETKIFLQKGLDRQISDWPRPQAFAGISSKQAVPATARSAICCFFSAHQ
jgi:hypothetical protein